MESRRHAALAPALNWPRIVVGMLLGELLPILMLVAIVVLWGPRDSAGASDFAARAGAWVGPVGGGLTVLTLAWWAGAAAARPVRQGFVLGSGVAALDFAILVATGAGFAWLFVLSNGGKVLAGMAGGYLANRNRSPETPSTT